jgi:cytochrome P450
MTTLEVDRTSEIPDHVARRVMLAEGHRDEVELYEAFEWIRANRPLARAVLDGYPPYWLVSKHADIMAIERDWETFSSAGLPGTSFEHRIWSDAELAFISESTGGTMRNIDTVVPLDPPLHTEIKDIANDWFRPAKLREREEALRELAREAIRTRLVPGVNNLDFVKEFALSYPLHVIMTIVGIPAEDEPRMMTLTQEVFGMSDPDLQGEAGDSSPANRAQREIATRDDFIAYFDAVVEDRRANPRDDLASVIANARDDSGEYYDKSWSYGWFIVIATAGHDTTSSTLSTIIEALADHPDQLAAVQADLTWIPDLVNEGLRWASPVKHFARQATRDTNLGGRTIRRGDRLVLCYPSANRDEAIFDDPNSFRFDRRPNRHIALGFGPHMCIGQHLAKLELRVMLEELLPRIVRLEKTGEPRYVLSNFVGGLKNLPVRLQLR